MNLLAVFLTGLLTGGLTCLAIQGGLLVAALSQNMKEKGVTPVIAFLVAKLIIYTLLGFLLGLLGSVFNFSITTTVVLQITVSIFMIGTALNLLRIHPVFRYFAISPPKILMRLVKNQVKNRAIFAPAILGAFTIFLPCGVTQAMMALAVVSGNPLTGSLVMFFFILGTFPLFFSLGYFTTKLSERLQQKFMFAAAFAIIILAIINIDNALTVSGSNITLKSLGRKLYCTLTICDETKLAAKPKTGNEITINITSTGYNPEYLVVKRGENITLHLKNISRGGCQQAFTIPKLSIRKIVRPGEEQTIQFTAPSNPGEIIFTCSMGMYGGKIEVI